MNGDGTPLADKLERWVAGFYLLLPNLGIAVLTFLLFFAGGWVVQRAVGSMLGHRDRQDLGTLLGGFLKWTILLFGGLVVATIIFPSIKPADLLSALGIGSVAISFAFKDILQNWLSGLPKPNICAGYSPLAIQKAQNCLKSHARPRIARERRGLMSHV